MRCLLTVTLRWPLAAAAWLLTIGLALGDTLPIRYTEPLKRSWQREVLGFRVDVPRGPWTAKDLFVTDESGAAIASQVSDVLDQGERKGVSLTVWLIADFAPWKSRTWMLHYGERATPSPATDLTAKDEPGACVLANELVAVRTGRCAERCAVPVEPGKVPAPILAVRGPSGAWLGHGWLESPRRVTGYSMRLIDDGPIFKRVRAEYDFEGGRYACSVTLRTGERVVHVQEEFDLGPPSAARDANFCFSFQEGLKPDTVRWAGRYYTPAFNPGKATFAGSDMREAVFPIDYSKSQRLLRLHGLFVWWPEAANYYAAYRANDPQSDLVAVFPERPSYWRRPTVFFLETTPDKQLVMRAPIRQPIAEWAVDGVEYPSPYYTGTVEPGTPRSLGIRQWGMLVAKAADVIPANDDFTTSGIRRAWTRYGQNPLDKIKDWTLAWPEPGPAAYPRGQMTGAELPALRARAAQVPALKQLVNHPRHRLFSYLVTQDPVLGDKLLHADSKDPAMVGVLPALRESVACFLDTNGDLGVRTYMHHGNFHINAAAPLFDVAMSVPSATPDDRREAMALYAFLLYKISDPDWLAYGAGFHLGNPNMPTSSLSLLGTGAALVPEHPQAADWMMRSVADSLHMLRDYVAPGGAWRECPHYQTDAAMSFLLPSSLQLKHAGFLDLFQDSRLKSTMLYHAQLLTPVDPRFGIRSIPPIGNSYYEPTSLYGRMAAGTASTDPTYARWMQWAWKAVGANYQYSADEMVCNEELPAAMPDLSSRHFPGFGTVMRSHVGTPDEAYLIFRMGYQHEHYENEQGEIVLYAKGTPLCLDFGSVYYPTMLRPWMHNRVAINHKLDWTSLGEVVENNLLQAADACLGRMTVREVFPWPEDPWEKTPPNVAPPPQPIGPTTWTRQVVFVKHERADGPHYVVLRDGLAGAGDDFTEFSLWGLADRVTTAGNVATYKGQLGVDLAVTVLDPASPTFTTGEYSHKYLSGAMAPFWQKVNGTKKFEEIQRYIRIKRADHGGYLAVLYPYKPGEAVPAFTTWADGAGVQATIGDEKHVVICASSAGRHQAGGIAIQGQRALVRLGPKASHLALLAGSRLKASGVAIEAPGPVAITISGKTVTGEANLAAPGELRLSLPAGVSAATARITADGQTRQLAVTASDGAIRFSLPKGRCSFALP